MSQTTLPPLAPVETVAPSRLAAAGRSLRRFIRTPKGIMLAILMGLTIVAAPRAGLSYVLPNLAVAAGVAMLLDMVLMRLRRGRWSVPLGALLTAWFLVLIIDAHESWPVFGAASALAIVSKWLLRTRWSNILNPAAVALVANAVIFGSAQSWWGALPELPWPLLGLLLVAALGTARYVNKLPMLLSFALVYLGTATGIAYLGSPAAVAELFRIPDLNAMIFFAGFMLTDPPTSPVRYRDQVVYGLVVALGSLAIYLTYGVVYYLPLGLLLGNSLESVRRYATRRRSR